VTGGQLDYARRSGRVLAHALRWNGGSIVRGRRVLDYARRNERRLDGAAQWEGARLRALPWSGASMMRGVAEAGLFGGGRQGRLQTVSAVA
jgi:hypothetical protein